MGSLAEGLTRLASCAYADSRTEKAMDVPVASITVELVVGDPKSTSPWPGWVASVVYKGCRYKGSGSGKRWVKATDAFRDG